MKSFKTISAYSLLVLVIGYGSSQAQQPAPSPNMSFFVTSTGSGKGGDLGGIEGADAHCQRLARAVGAGNKTWRAYLSTQARGNVTAINARDRIGRGPWVNFKGEAIANNVDDLHGDANRIGGETALTEQGRTVPTGSPNYHDILTGSQTDGRAFPAGQDRTCQNWTSSTSGSAMLGHADRRGVRDTAATRSWNSSHPSHGSDGGCSLADLNSTWGNGLFYCFAAN